MKFDFSNIQKPAVSETVETKPEVNGEPKILTPHEQNLSKIADYHKKWGTNPENTTFDFGDFAKDESGKTIVDPETKLPKRKLTPYSEFSKDPEKTATYLSSLEKSPIQPKGDRKFSAEELQEKYKGNYFGDIAGDIDYHKKSGDGLMSYMSEMLPEIEEDPALFDAIIDVAPIGAFDKGDLEGALKYLYNAGDTTKEAIQKAYNKEISRKIK